MLNDDPRNRMELCLMRRKGKVLIEFFLSLSLSFSFSLLLIVDG